MTLRISHEGNALFVYRKDKADGIEDEIGSIYRGKLSLYDGVAISREELFCIAEHLLGEGSD